MTMLPFERKALCLLAAKRRCLIFRTRRSLGSDNRGGYLLHDHARRQALLGACFDAGLEEIERYLVARPQPRAKPARAPSVRRLGPVDDALILARWVPSSMV
jgi:hypothetical protein